jgi:hypothetical protein
MEDGVLSHEKFVSQRRKDVKPQSWEENFFPPSFDFSRNDLHMITAKTKQMLSDTRKQTFPCALISSRLCVKLSSAPV